VPVFPANGWHAGARHPPDQLEIGFQQLERIRLEKLDDDFTPTPLRPVNLPDAGRCQRFRVKTLEQFRQHAPVLTFEKGFHQVDGHRADSILKPGQFSGVRRRQGVRTDADDLPYLDEHNAQLLQRLT